MIRTPPDLEVYEHDNGKFVGNPESSTKTGSEDYTGRIPIQNYPKRPMEPKLKPVPQVPSLKIEYGSNW